MTFEQTFLQKTHVSTTKNGKRRIEFDSEGGIL